MTQLPTPPGHGKAHSLLQPPVICSGPILPSLNNDRVWFGQKPSDPISLAISDSLGPTQTFDGLSVVSRKYPLD